MNIVKVEKQQTSVQIPDELKDVFNLSDNMASMVVPRLPQVRILHGAEMFDSNEKKVETFEGVIIDHNRTNAWWEKDIKESGGKKFPDCFSIDAIRPNDGEMRQSETCELCKWSQRGSDRKGGGGTDCKSMRRIHLITEGSILPRRLTITASSFINFDKFMTGLYDMGYPYATVVTKFFLLKGPREGFEYSIVDFSFVRAAEVEELYVVADYINRYRDAAKTQEVTTDEYAKPEDTSFDTDKMDDSDIPY